MFQKLEYVQDNQVAQPEWITDMRDYNHLPTPFRRSTEKEFQATFRCYSPKYIEFRQVFLSEHDFCDVHIMYFQGVAFAIAHRTDQKRTRYFKIGCHHNYRELNDRELEARKIRVLPNDHYQICTKCGHERSYNSGD